MTHEDLRELYELYALGLVEPAERTEIDEHLSRGCETCTAGVRQALTVNSAILSFAPDAAPRKALKRRVLSGIGVERHNWGWLAAWGAVTAALLVAVLWFSVDAQRTRMEVARIRPVVDFLRQPDTRQVNFANGAVLVNPRTGVLLVASNLAPLVEGKTYEMWLIPQGASPKPAGLFQPDLRGNTLHLEKGPVESTISSVAVTVEPESGSRAPTTAPIIVVPLTPVS